MKALSVAEKPSVAKELANIIGGNNIRKRNGYSQFNHIFDIDNCQFKNISINMSITSVLGHIMGLEFDESYQKWQSCRPEELFTAPIKKEVSPDMINIKKTLVEEARRCNILILWLDCDLEGENIAYEVISICREANRNLDIYRARFSALIPRDIFRTLQNPDRPNLNMSDAVDARQEIDLRLGAAFTRFQTLRLQAKFEALKDSVLSYGPCQFPTLGFVVERYLKIKNFIPEEFWSISCEVETDDPDERTGKLTTRFSWERGRLYDQLSCLILYETCVDAQIATVTECKSRPTTRQRPSPLNTIELQKRASRFFKMGSEETMKVAESLYQRGILSYPRTETDMFKEGFELIPLLEDQRQNQLWGNYVDDLLQQGKFIWPRPGGHDDQAHPPIHPTKCVQLDTLASEQERNIYELVTRHFIASCSPDGIGSQTTVNIVIPYPDGEEFQATGLMVLERNWLDVYSKWEKWTGNKIGSFKVGDTFTPNKMELTSGITAPPLLLSESDLIAEMDNNGIGTDATIAQHISTIQERNYAYKNEDQRFVPTERGIGLIEGYNDMGYQLNKPYLRASMEQDCQKIVKGELRKDEMIKNCLDQMKICFLTCSREAQKLDLAMSKYFHGLGQAPDHMYRVLTRNLSTCGVCHNGMDLKISRDDGNQSRFLHCSFCSTVHTMPKKGDLTQTQHECPICKYQVLAVRNADTGKEHTICPKCFGEPPGPPIASVEGAAGDFRCFMCNHPTCPLSLKKGSEITLSPCYETQCSGSMKLKKVEKNNSFFFGCSKFPTCKATWWLPKCVRQVEEVADGFCNNCSSISGDKGKVSLIKVSINMSQAPPGCDPEFIACPCCSSAWQTLYHTPMQCPTSQRRFSNGNINNNTNNNTNTTTINNSSNRGNLGISKNNNNNNNNNNVNGRSGNNHIELSYGTLSTGYSDNIPTRQYPPVSNNVNPWNFNPTNSSTSASSTTTSISSTVNPITIGTDYMAAASGIGLPKTGRGSNRGRNSTNFSGRGNNNNNNNNNSNNSGYNNNNNNNNSNNSGNSNSTSFGRDNQEMKSVLLGPNCNCGEPSVVRTVTKDSGNKGKVFYACNKPRNEQCKFFAWADDTSNSNVNSGDGNSNSNSSGSNWRGGSGRSSGGRGGNSVMICSRCKQSGHFARNCPSKEF